MTDQGTTFATWTAERGAATIEWQRELFQAVVDALPVSLHVIDREFRIVVWNRGREEGPFGRPRGEVLGEPLFKIVGGEDVQLRREYEAVFRTGEAIVTEVESSAGGPPRAFRIEKVPMRLGADGDVTHVVTVGRDVTEQRAFQRAMNETEKLAAVGRLSAGVAHEIRNPLAIIAGCAEALRGQLRGPLDAARLAELCGDAELIEEEAYRCKEILDGLLDVSRLAPQDRSACDLNGLVRRVARLARHNPRIAALSLQLELGAGLPQPMASEDHLLQVLLCLVINAADAAGAGGTVTLRTLAGRAREVVFSVEDDGPGIAPEIRDRIFEPFFTTKPPGQGTGLGLAVAYGLVHAHGGRIEVHSPPPPPTDVAVFDAAAGPSRAPIAAPHGARFDVILPVAPLQPTHEDQP